MLGAARVIAIDRFQERLDLARSLGAITVDYSEEDVSVLTALKDLTGGVGPDSCIDAVGLEAHSNELQGIYDVVKTALFMETDRPSVLRQAIQAVRKGGTLSIPGVYGGLLDKVPFGAAFGKGITMKMARPTCTTTCSRCWSALRRVRSIPATSFLTTSPWNKPRRCTKSGVTKKRK
nr:zinc-binding dehydrogenase [Granulicella aggregans]